MQSKPVASAPSPEELAWEITTMVFDLWYESETTPLPTEKDIAKAVATLLRSRMERAERWIPVSEQVPKKVGTHVLISYGSGPWVCEAVFEWGFDSKPAWGFASPRPGAGFAWNVKYWRPLPSAPDTERS